MINEKQLAAVTHIYEQGETYLVGPMGCGKTLTALTAMDELLKDGHVHRVLVIAPRKVCEQVWMQEVNKWGLHRLNVAIATGTPDNRERALTGSANVVCINFENLAWLFSKTNLKAGNLKAGNLKAGSLKAGSLFSGFDMLVVDEATKMKAGGKAFKSLRRHLSQFNTRLAMSGTPVSEDFGGLFYQAMIVDDGKAYGKNRQQWLERYFTPTDYMRYSWEVVTAADLLAPFKHCMVTLPSYSDELPALIERTVLLGGCRTPEYDGLARDMIVNNVTAANAAVLTSKLQQAACGFLYDDDGETVPVHCKKSEWLAARLWDSKTVIVYQYKEELARLKTLFPNCFEIKDIAAFKRSAAGLLVMHPRSAGHGISLVEASTMIFMGPVWSRDLTRQTIARCWRRGQTSTTTVYTLAGAGTIEESMIDREAGKAVHHAALLAALSG